MVSQRFDLAPFEVEAKDGQARAARLKLAHGEVRTPVFMPVGTYGTVKGMTPEALETNGAQIILGNAYHLYIRPGLEVLGLHGGLHDMMAWPHPILTDSGGYQIFSLQELRRIDEQGIRFRDHKAGDWHTLTPEKVVQIQEIIGSDIMMAFDECPALPCTQAYMEASMARTTRWARRCLEARTRPDCALFGITQGGVDLGLRRQHIEAMCGLPFDGFAIGGLSVGEAKPSMYDTVEGVAPLLPESRPRYLMGVGTPRDLLQCIARGVDMFDCVMPTRNGRNGQIFTSRGRLTIKHARHKHDLSPADPACACYACANFSRAYLRHLFINNEMLSGHLLTLHNVHYYLKLVEGAREAIGAGQLGAYIATCEAGWEEEGGF